MIRYKQIYLLNIFNRILSDINIKGSILLFQKTIPQQTRKNLV